MKKHHMENFGTWESTLRDHIYRIQLHRNVRITVFLESINKAQLLLDDLGASRVDDATVYNLVVSQYLKLYLKINPRTDTDLLAMQYHKRAVIYRQRYDQTEPLDATDVEEHRRTGRHRTVAFMRDYRHPSFATLMEILDWRSRAAIHIAGDSFIPLRRGPRAPGRQRITLVGAASTLVEDQALVIAFAFASPVAKNELYHAGILRT